VICHENFYCPSPDGSRIAFVATSASGRRALWIRRVDSVAPERLAGTEEASGPPFWSPDSRFLGFFAQGKLKKIDPSGGPALQATVVIADPGSGNRDIWLLDLASGNLARVTTNPANDWQVAWAPDSGQIVFASDRNGQSSVYRKAIDAVDEELLLRIPGRTAFPKDWSTDGRFLTLDIDRGTGTSGIWALALAGSARRFPWADQVSGSTPPGSRATAA
jgi:Tol biopolymer transport system component